MAHEFCLFNPQMFLFGPHRVLLIFFLMYLICMPLDKTQPLQVTVVLLHAVPASVLFPLPALEHLNTLRPVLVSRPSF